MIQRIACYLLLALSCCTPHAQSHLETEQTECEERGGEPELYLKEFSKPKTQGVYCATKN